MTILETLCTFGSQVVASCVGVKLVIWLDERKTKKNRNGGGK